MDVLKELDNIQTYGMTIMIDAASNIANIKARLLKSLLYLNSCISVLPINLIDTLLYKADDGDQQEQYDR